MKNLFRLIILIFIIVSCSTTKKADRESDKNSISSTVVFRDGTSLERAIIIIEKSERSGITAENDWIRKNYPGYRKAGQSLVFDKKRPYDIINIENVEGTTKSIYFDISEFFGKN
jgi:hypothetical protein